MPSQDIEQDMHSVQWPEVFHFSLSKTQSRFYVNIHPKGTQQMNKPSVCSGVWNRYHVCYDGGYFPTLTLLCCSSAACLQVSLLKSKARQKAARCAHPMLQPLTSIAMRDAGKNEVPSAVMRRKDILCFTGFSACKGQVNAKGLK